MRPLVLLASGSALFASVSTAVLTQDPPLRTLSKVDFEYDEPFSCISGLRELSDGRIVVADQREKTVQIINLRTGATVKVGREGQGPGEWAAPAGIFPGIGDTTLLWDQGNRRFLPIFPDGTTGKAFSPDISGGNTGFISITPPRGVDRQGRIYLPGSDFAPSPGGGPPVGADSTAILRFDPRTPKLDTLGFLKNPKPDVQTNTSGNRSMVMIMAPNPLIPQATWTVTPDGRIVIAQPEPYHLEYVSPAKVKTVGPAIRYTKLAVTQGDKEAPFVPNNCQQTISIGGPPGAGGGGRGAAPTTTFGGGRGARPAPRDDWPESKPPFLGGGRLSNSVVSAPNGDVWVLRTRAANDAIPTYDIFDARGQVTGRMALPKGARLVAFGNGTVYLTRMDDDDLLYIQRYRLDQAR